MNSTEYIIDVVNKIADVFKDTTVRYGFDKRSEIHFIEISPIDFYEADCAFAEFERDIIIDFTQKYPLESICFISEEDSALIKQPILVKYGNNCNLNIDIKIRISIQTTLTENDITWVIPNKNNTNIKVENKGLIPNAA